MRLAFPLILALGLGCNGDKDGTTDTGATPTDTSTTPTGPTTGTGDDRVQAILALDGDAAAGATLYLSNCQACHDADGTGSLGGGASLPMQVPVLGEQGVIETVLRGIGNMDAYDFLENQQVADVAAHVVEAYGAR